MEAVAGRYAIALTPALADLIRRDDPADPIARQFIPDGRELSAIRPRPTIRSATTPKARSRVWCIAIPTAC